MNIGWTFSDTWNFDPARAGALRGARHNGIALLAPSRLITLALGAVLAIPGFVQAQAATIRGVVGDSTSGLPILGVRVGLDGDTIVAETDYSGAFEFRDVPAGVHIVRLTALGFEERQLRFHLSPQLGNPQDIGLVLLTALPPVNIRVRGIVHDTSLSTPVARASVSLVGFASAAVDSVGHFVLPSVNLQPGHYTVLIRAIGYYPATILVTAAEAGTIDIDAPLNRIPFLLSDIEVTADAIQRSRLRDFYQRAETGLGRYFEPATVDSMRRRMIRASDLLRGIPGVSIRPTRYGNHLEFLSCGNPLYVVDGMIMPEGLALDDLLDLEEISAVEVYIRASQVPLEFSMIQASLKLRPPCGAIVLWTR